MEEYIFILIAIALSIVSAVNRNKKKNAAMAGQVQPPATPSYLEKIMSEEFFGEKEPVAKAPKPQTAPLPHKPMIHQKVKKREPQPFLNHESRERRIRKREMNLMGVEMIQKEVPTKKQKKVHDYMKDFSLKKAMVYSEIINTKY